ncbi:MAG: hypothetical protein AB7O59_13820 [Pirellulales bacterium]
MNSRERWTVYPLLFMTLGIALRDKVTREVDTGRVSCRELVVTDQAGRRQVVLEANAEGGLVRTFNSGPGVSASLGHFSLQHYNRVAGLLLTDRAGNLMLGSILVPAMLQVRPAEPPEEQPAQKPTDEAAPEEKDQPAPEAKEQSAPGDEVGPAPDAPDAGERAKPPADDREATDVTSPDRQPGER